MWRSTYFAALISSAVVFAAVQTTGN